MCIRDSPVTTPGNADAPRDDAGKAPAVLGTATATDTPGLEQQDPVKESQQFPGSAGGHGV
eukprot:9575933-Alexandrium_andersonii.AAC.1